MGSKQTTMKPIYITLSFMLVLSLSIKAQNFTFNPAQHINEEIEAENYSSHGISLITSDLSAITFKWSLLENTLPVDWSYSLCDLGGCYVGIPNSGTMQEITEQNALDGITGFLKLNITASTFYGEGDVVFYVYESGNSSNGDTISMHISWANSSSGIVNNTFDAIRMFPNPVESNLNFNNLNGIENIEILGMNGQSLYDLKPNDTEFQINLSGLKEGIYLARLTNDAGEYVTRRIVKTN